MAAANIDAPPLGVVDEDEARNEVAFEPAPDEALQD